MADKLRPARTGRLTVKVAEAPMQPPTVAVIVACVLNVPTLVCKLKLAEVCPPLYHEVTGMVNLNSRAQPVVVRTETVQRDYEALDSGQTVYVEGSADRIVERGQHHRSTKKSVAIVAGSAAVPTSEQRRAAEKALESAPWWCQAAVNKSARAAHNR